MRDPTTPRPSDQPTQPHPIPPPAGPALPPPGALPQHTPIPGAPVPPVPKKRPKVWAWVVGGTALVIALCCGGAVIAVIDGGDDAKRAAATTMSASSTTAAPTSAPPTTAPTMAPSPTKAIPPSKAAPPPKPKPVSYKTLSARQWKLIAKDPDAYIGKTYVVYGVVTQFDAATGVDTFRADVGHKRMANEFDYPTNTMLTGSERQLKNLVEDDVFQAKVRVLGSFSYETQIGGETTAPLLQVDSIKVL